MFLRSEHLTYRRVVGGSIPGDTNSSLQEPSMERVSPNCAVWHDVWGTQKCWFLMEIGKKNLNVQLIILPSKQRDSNLVR